MYKHLIDALVISFLLIINVISIAISSIKDVNVVLSSIALNRYSGRAIAYTVDNSLVNLLL